MSVPFADDIASIERRRAARQQYQRAAIAAREVRCFEASNDASDRALVLGLRDPSQRAEAIADLEASMRSTEHSLRRLPIALQLGLKLDLEATEQEIDRQMTLSGGESRDAALARLAIAMTKSANEASEYIRIHRQELEKHVNPTFLTGMEIASLVDSRQLAQAEERIEALSQGDQHRQERERLLALVAEARESDPVASREQQFAASDALTDLVLLVEGLERNKDWTRLAKYAAILFQRTRDLPATQVYARSLFEIGDFDGLVRFLELHQDLASASDQLQALLAWSLFNLGALKECREVLAEPVNDIATPRAR